MSDSVRLAVVEDQLFTRETTMKLLRTRYGEERRSSGSPTWSSCCGTRAGALTSLSWISSCVRAHCRAVTPCARRGAWPCAGVLRLESGEALERAHAAGAHGYVSKDTAEEETLVEAVDAVLAGKTFVDPALLAKIGAGERKQLTARQQEVLRLEALGCTWPKSL